MTLSSRIIRVLKPTLLAVVLFYILLGVYKARVPVGLAWNTTPSIPLGLYATLQYNGSSLERGQLVCFRYQAPGWAKDREYVPEGMRLCKPVAAVAGDRITVEGAQVTVLNTDGQTQRYALQPLDSKGRPLPQTALSSGVLGPGQLLLIANYRPNSLDSRYLGLISQAQVTHRTWPLIAPH